MFIGYSGSSGWSYGLWSGLVGLGNAVFGSLFGLARAGKNGPGNVPED